MKPLKSIIAILCILLSCQIMQAQEKYSKVKFFPPADRMQRAELLGQLEIDHFHTGEGGAVIAEISATALSRLAAGNYRHEVLIDDVTAHFVAESQKYFRDVRAGLIDPEANNRVAFEPTCQSVNTFMPTPTLFSTNGLPPGTMGGFLTLSQMSSEMDELVAAYPTLVQKFSIGNSYEGRPIYCLKISDNVGTDEANEPEMLFQGLQHAREAITGTSLIFMAQYLAENYAVNADIQALLNNREIFIIPCVNVDGYFYNETIAPGGGGMHRKNRRDNTIYSDTRDGVDLNRNYGVDWADCAGASSSCGTGTMTADTYWGTGPFSEPESQAVRDLCFDRNFVTAFDQHCSGPYYSLPFGRRSYHTMTTDETNFYRFVPALMGKHNGHRAGDSYATVAYEVAGGAKDWWLMGDIETFPGEPNKKGKVWGMTGEAGGGGFWAPSSQIIEISKNLTYQNIQLIYSAGSYVDIQDKTDVNILSTGGNFTADIRRIGLGDEPVTVSMVPITNVQSVGAPVTIASMPTYFSTSTINIPYVLFPSIGTGQVIRFAWKVETGGITYYDTVTKLFNPTVLFEDNMEGTFSTNWTATSNVASTWAFTNLVANSGARSMHESPGSGIDYTTNTTRRAILNTTLNLSNATAAYISFWVRHRSENFRDKLRVQISTNTTNGTDGTWTTLCGKNTVTESNTTNGGTMASIPSLTGIRQEWTREHFDLTDYIGTAPTANTRLRFEFTSDGDASNFEDERDDGFYIDDIKVVKSINTLVTLPAHFLSFTGRLLATNEVHLKWTAAVDGNHSHFEVQRSTDRTNFTTVGTVSSQPPYELLDRNPVIGSNFYRIKQVDVNGQVVYSRTIHILYNPGSFGFVLFPNPARDEITLTLKPQAPEKLRVVVTDVIGKEMYRAETFVDNGSRDLKIDMRSWKPQVYILKVVNSNEETLTVQKFIKQ